MSKENVKKFFDALAQDVALAEELDTRIAKVTLEFAAEKGFEFTAEDLMTEQTELSDKELDQVNGGGAITPAVIRRDYFKAHGKK